MIELTDRKIPCLSCGTINQVWEGSDWKGWKFEAIFCEVCDAIYRRLDGWPWDLIIGSSREWAKLRGLYICAKYRKVSNGYSAEAR